VSGIEGFGSRQGMILLYRFVLFVIEGVQVLGKDMHTLLLPQTPSNNLTQQTNK
jgi:hypothetical protein